jgi:hypothetical protein
VWTKQLFKSEILRDGEQQLAMRREELKARLKKHVATASETAAFGTEAERVLGAVAEGKTETEMER